MSSFVQLPAQCIYKPTTGDSESKSNEYIMKVFKERWKNIIKTKIVLVGIDHRIIPLFFLPAYA